MLERLPEESLSLLSELLDQARSLAAAEKHLPAGTFVSKLIRGKKYWYLQVKGAGIRHQMYLGPESPELLERMSRIKTARAELEPDRRRLQALNDALIAIGADKESLGATTVLELLSAAGFFRAGAVLVGTRAFSAVMTRAGYRATRLGRTQDIDVAIDPGIALAFPSEAARELPALLGSEESALIPIPELHPARPSTSFRVRGQQLRVDFLTPLVGRPSERPVVLRGLRLAATPLRFLDYLIEDAGEAVMVGARPVLVRVPHAGRLALHKLAIASRRSSVEVARAIKDKAQAEMLLEVLFEDQPSAIQSAVAALSRRPNLVALVQSEAKRRLAPELATRLESELED